MHKFTDSAAFKELEAKNPEITRKAVKDIELARSFPVKGGTVIPKKTGGWFNLPHNGQTPQNTR